MIKFLRHHKGFTLIELLTVIAILAIIAAMLMSGLMRAREGARRAVCASNLKQVFIMFQLYAGYYGGQYPMCQDQYGTFIFESDGFYPEFLSDAQIMACPSDPDIRPYNFRLTRNANIRGRSFEVGTVHPDCIAPISYLYTGWVLRDDAEALSFLASYTWLDSVMPISDPATNAWRNTDLNVASFGFVGGGNIGDGDIYRLASGIERFLITDINAVFPPMESLRVPVMWDQISTHISDFSHVPASANVLYSDGSVLLRRYDKLSDEFPVSPMYAAINGGIHYKELDYCPKRPGEK